IMVVKGDFTAESDSRYVKKCCVALADRVK
ncbi:unnamed protein product, partial [marine sediment metagenome]